MSFVQPYLFFGGHAEEAIEFYRSAIGADPGLLMRYSESPEPCPDGAIPAGFENKVMHAEFKVGDSLVMCSDGDSEGTNFAGFTLSICLDTEADANRAFDALADGGEVVMPLGKTFWSPCFGMLRDRFGMGWMVTVPTGEQA